MFMQLRSLIFFLFMFHLYVFGLSAEISSKETSGLTADSYAAILQRLDDSEKIQRQLKEEIMMLKARVQSDELHDFQTGSIYKRLLAPAGASVGFTACVSVPDLINLGVYHTIHFDKIITNLGDAYHNSTGVFTAPYRGLYVFAVTAMSRAGKSQYLQIIQDGTLVNEFLADASGDQTWHSTGNQWVLELNKGSEVWIQTTHAGEIHGNCFTLFSGFLVNVN